MHRTSGRSKSAQELPDGMGEKRKMKEKLLSLMGIARRAGRLSLGFDAAADSIKRGRSRLILTAGDLSERSGRAIAAYAQQAGTEVCTTELTMEEIGKAVGKSMTGIISVNDSGFAEKLKTLCAE